MRAKVVLYARTKIANGAYRMEPVAFKRGQAVVPKALLSFYLRYSANGKRHYEPIKATDLNAAVVAYKCKAVELDNAARGLGTLNSPSDGDTPDSKTLAEALTEFISQQQSKAVRTRENYEFALNEFVNFCGPNNLLAKTGRPCALKYRDWLYQQSLSETTRRERMTRVAMFLRYFGITKVYARQEWPRPNKKTPDAYSREEISALLNACQTEDERLLIEIFLYSGGRRAEVRHLQKSDIQIRKNGKEEIAVVLIKEKPEFGWQTKGKRDRAIRLPLEFAKRLLAARSGYKPDDLLFPNRQGQPNKHLDRIVFAIAKRADIDVTGKPFHKFRRTYATLKSNLDTQDRPSIQTLQKELGHQNIQTTLRYLEASNPESAEVGRATDSAFGDFARR
jgi:integrase